MASATESAVAGLRHALRRAPAAAPVNWKQRWRSCAEKHDGRSHNDFLQSFLARLQREAVGWSDARCAAAVRADVLRWRTLLAERGSAGAERHAVAVALALPHRLLANGCHPGPETFEALMLAVALTGRVDPAFSLREAAKDAGVARTVRFYQLMLRCVARGRADRGAAGKVFALMRADGALPRTPHERAGLLRELLRYHAHRGAAGEAAGAFSELVATGAAPSAADYSFVVTTRGSLREALRWVGEARQRCAVAQLPPLFEAVFRCCRRVGDVRGADAFMQALLDGTWVQLLPDAGAGAASDSAALPAPLAADEAAPPALPEPGGRWQRRWAKTGGVAVLMEKAEAEPICLVSVGVGVWNAYLAVLAGAGLIAGMKRVLRDHPCIGHVTLGIVAMGCVEAARAGRREGVGEALGDVLARASSEGFVGSRRVLHRVLEGYAHLGDVAMVAKVREMLWRHGVVESAKLVDHVSLAFVKSGKVPPPDLLVPRMRPIRRCSTPTDLNLR